MNSKQGYSLPASNRGTSIKRTRSWDYSVNNEKKKTAVHSAERTEQNNSIYSTQFRVTTPTIHVSNLHMRLTEPHLLKLFQKIGPVNRVYIHPNQRQSTNYAFVEFSDRANAQKALDTFDGTMLLNMPLRIRPAKDKTFHNNESKQESTSPAHESKDFIQNQSRAVSAKIQAVKRSIEQKQSMNKSPLNN